MKKLFLFLSLILLPYIGYAQSAENWENDYQDNVEQKAALRKDPPKTDDGGSIASDPTMPLEGTTPVGTFALPIFAFLAAYGAIVLAKNNKQLKNA